MWEEKQRDGAPSPRLPAAGNVTGIACRAGAGSSSRHAPRVMPCARPVSTMERSTPEGGEHVGCELRTSPPGAHVNDGGRPDPDLSDAYLASSSGGSWWRTMPPNARSSSPARVHGSESPFFRSKFRIPDDPRHFVPRPRLLALLDDLAEYPIIAIVAPAGAGKTAVAADWLRHADRSCAWLALDDADREPVQFWRSVVAVLDPLVAGHSP